MSYMEWLESVIKDPRVIDRYPVYYYTFIDMPEFIVPANVVLSGVPNEPKIVEHVRARFLSAGWEGDGKIGLIWLPPFVTGAEDGWGTLVWHVKQSNNGISWLMSSEPLPFGTLTLARR